MTLTFSSTGSLRRLAWTAALGVIFAATVWKGVDSSAGSGMLAIVDLAAAAGGGFLIRHGFRQLRKKNMIENVPSSPIRSVAMGLAEIKGHSPAAADLSAPLSGTRCHYFRYRVEEERNTGKRREWVTVDKGESNVPFPVEDATGRIRVNPARAELLLRRDYERVDRGEGWFGWRRRYREWRIDPGEFVYVIGTVAKTRDPFLIRRARLQESLRSLKRDPEAARRFDLDGDGRLDEAEWRGAVAVVKDDQRREELSTPAADPLEDLMVEAGDLESTFVISDRDERSIASSLGWRAFGAVAFGGVIALVMVISVLGRLAVRPGGWTFPWETLFH